jgi:GNAT superfamily N-acetyltransferase
LEALPPPFVERFGEAVGWGDVEVISAHDGDRPVGVLVLAFRPSVSLAGLFASVEDLHVEPGARGRGAGRALLGAAEARCREKGVSYIEVQTDDEAAEFYRRSGFEPEAEVRVLSKSIAIGPGDG